MKVAALNFLFFLLVLAAIVTATMAIYGFLGPSCPDGTFKLLHFYEWHCVPEVGRSP
jgi:hypothetical protein